MRELIKIRKSQSGKQTFNARDLWEFLGVKKDFSNWIKAQIKRAFLIENVDFVRVAQKGERTNKGFQGKIEYHVTVEAGEKIGMMSGTVRGDEIRNYFINCRDQLKEIQNQFKIPQTLSEALQLAADQAKQIEQLEHNKKENEPKVLFADSVTASKSSILIGELAKILKQNGVEIGQNRLFEWMRVMGI